MTRKLLVKIIAILCISQGLWNFGNSIYAFFLLPPLFVIRIVPLISGVLELYAGVNLFRLHETGRKLLVVLSYIFAGIMILAILWTLFFWKEGYASAIYYFDETIFTSENRFISAGIDFVFLTIPLLIIFFLSNEKTKILFANEAFENTNTEPLVKSK